jgi:hypothetical protein
MSKTSTKEAPVDQRAESVTMIPIADVHPSPANERKSLGDLGELVESIKSVGILEPLIVVPVDHGYEVVVGHRRRRAGELADLKWLEAVDPASSLARPLHDLPAQGIDSCSQLLDRVAQRSELLVIHRGAA